MERLFGNRLTLPRLMHFLRASSPFKVHGFSVDSVCLLSQLLFQPFSHMKVEYLSRKVHSGTEPGERGSRKKKMHISWSSGIRHFELEFPSLLLSQQGVSLTQWAKLLILKTFSDKFHFKIWQKIQFGYTFETFFEMWL